MSKPRKRSIAVAGGIVEIETPNGLAYAQFTHRHPEYGELIRVFSGVHDQRPEDFSEIVTAEEQFMAFILLDAAVRAGLLAIVDREEIPESKRAFPTFRSNAFRKLNEVTKNWWLWDGEQSWFVGELTDEQRHFPILEIANTAAIVIRLTKGWHPEMFP
ncbi:MAG: hypothetical protein WBW04_02650 [Nitrolancea sp.]